MQVSIKNRIKAGLIIFCRGLIWFLKQPFIITWRVCVAIILKIWMYLKFPAMVVVAFLVFTLLRMIFTYFNMLFKY